MTAPTVTPGMDALTRDRMLRLAGVPLPEVDWRSLEADLEERDDSEELEERRMPYAGQKWRHGWVPFVLNPVETLTPDGAAQDYGDELDRVSVGDASVVARSEGTLTVEADAGGEEGLALIHASPSPAEARQWADYIDDGVDLEPGESTHEHGLTVVRVDGGLALRWPDSDPEAMDGADEADLEELDGVDLTDDEVPDFTQALRDMAYVTEDNQTVPDDEDESQDAGVEEPDAAMMRHRQLQLLGIELRAFDTAKHPHYGKGVAQGKGGQFRPIAAQIGDALKQWLSGGGHDPDPLKGFSQPQLKKAAEQLGLNPPKGMRLVPLKSLLMQHARGGKVDVPETPAVAKKAAPRTSPAGPDDKVAALAAAFKGDSYYDNIQQVISGDDPYNRWSKEDHSPKANKERAKKLRDMANGARNLAEMRLANSPGHRPGDDVRRQKAEEALIRADRLDDIADALDPPAHLKATAKKAATTKGAPKARESVLGGHMDQYEEALHKLSAADVKRVAEELNVPKPVGSPWPTSKDSRIRYVLTSLDDARRRNGYRAHGRDSIPDAIDQVKADMSVAPKPDLAATIDQLAAIKAKKEVDRSDRVAVTGALAPLTNKELDGVGAHFNYPLSGTKEQKRGDLVDYLVDSRLDTQAFKQAFKDAIAPKPAAKKAAKALPAAGEGKPLPRAGAAGAKRVDAIDRRLREVNTGLFSYGTVGNTERVKLFREQQKLQAEREKLIASGVPDPKLIRPVDEAAAHQARQRISALRRELDAELMPHILAGQEHGPEGLDLQDRIEAVNELGRTANRLDPEEIDEALDRLRKPGGARRPAKRAPAKPRTPKPDAAQIKADFAQAVARPMPSDRDRFKQQLGALTGTQLSEVALAHGVKLPAGTKQSKADYLVEHLIGYRLNSESIRHGVSDDPELKRINAAMVEANLRGDRAEYERLHQQRLNLGKASELSTKSPSPQPKTSAAKPTARSLPRSGRQWDWQTIADDGAVMHGDSASMNLAQALHRAGREDDAQYVADMRYRISSPRGEHTPDDVEHMVTDLKTMMEREPDPNVRALYQRALRNIDAPATPPPALPTSTPPVLRQMVDELNKIPNARRSGHFAGGTQDVSAVDQLAAIIKKVDAGDGGSTGTVETEIRDTLRSLHESVDGAYQMWRLEKLLDDPEIRKWVRSHYPSAGGPKA